MPYRKGMPELKVREVKNRATLLGWYFEQFNSNVFIVRPKTHDGHPPWEFNGRLSDDASDEFSQAALYAALDLIFREEESRDTHI